MSTGSQGPPVAGMLPGLALLKVVTDEAGAPRDYTLIFVNDGFRQMVGLTRDARPGMSFAEAIRQTGGDAEDWLDKLCRVALTGTEERFEHRAGPARPGCSVTVLCPAPGRLAVVSGDASLAPGAVARPSGTPAERCSPHGTAAAGRIVHDLNNTLTTITGLTDLILPGAPEGADLRGDVLQIRSAAERAAGLARQLGSPGANRTAAPGAAPPGPVT